MTPFPIRLSTVLALAPLLFSSQASAQAMSAAASKSQSAARLDAQLQAALRIDPKRAHRAAQLGDEAESQGRLEEALADYEEAAHYAPQDVAIVQRSAELRSELVRTRVEAAERDALNAQFEQATEELASALRIDPGNSVVAERLSEMKSMSETAPQLPQKNSGILGLPQLRPQEGRHNLDLRGDTKTVYEQVTQMYGIKAAFDPDLQPRNVRLRVDDVDFYTAMSLLTAETATFWRPLNPTLMFVTSDTPEKRREYGLQAEQTFVLPASVDPQEMTELLRILRDITGATHMQLDASSRSITMRDAPEKLALAGRLIREVEKSRGEVLLEIEILEVDRNNAQKLGITPPSSARLFSISPNILTQLSQAQDINTLATLLAGIFGGNAGANGAQGISALIPPLIAFGGGKSTFLLTLPGAAADFSQALSLVRSGRQILLRAEDGKPATFFVGDRFPVTLSLLSGSLGTGSFTPGVTNGVLPSTSFNVGKGPVAIVAADFRNSGQLDLAVVNELDNTLTILLNQGSGNFTQAANSPIQLGPARSSAPAVPPAIASPVLTGSGFHDLLVTDPTNNNVIVLLGNGDGTFKLATGSPVAVGATPSAIVTADFNGDGNQDFAVTNFTDSTVSIFRGDGTGAFTQDPNSPIALPSGSQNPVAMVAGDFNADGLQDLAILNNNGSTTVPGNVAVLLNGSSGAFSPAGTATPVGNGPVAIAAGDLNGDSRTDLAVVNQTDNSVSVLLNNGDATFAAAPNSPLATGSTPTAVTIADFDANGNNDIAVTDSAANSISVFLGLGVGLFAPQFELPAGNNPTAFVAANFVTGTAPDVAITDNPSGATGQVTLIFSPAHLFSNSTALAQQPYPGSEYVDLGVKVKATPSLHPDNDVTLQLDFEIRALSGSSVNGIPIISNRTLSQTVRVQEEETTLIGGLLDNQETRTLTGLPGFANLPVGLGYVFGQRNNQLQDTELIILITPHKLRMPDRESRPIYTGRDTSLGLGNTRIGLPSEREVPP